MLQLGPTSLAIVWTIAGIAAISLLYAVWLRRKVLAEDEGTTRMQEIARAVQEGASAYLNRQFRTLGLFAAIAFGLLFLLPGDLSIKIGRSIFFCWAPASLPRSATWACGWRCAPTCAWRPPRCATTDASRAPASRSAPAEWWA